jgi:hypothetical protein
MSRAIRIVDASILITCLFATVPPLEAQGSGTTSAEPSVDTTATAATAPPADSGTTPPAQAPAEATNHVETPLAGLKLSGYAEASYSYSTDAVGTTVVGRLYDHFNDQFVLNALKLVLDKPYTADKLDAGFHADLLFGKNVSLGPAGGLQSAGLNLGDDADVTQLYATLNIPTANGNGLQLKFGKMVTLMGVEVIEDVVNPNWSEGNQFIYVENFTALGASAEYKFNKYVDAQLRVTNGWDVVEDNNSHKSFMGRLGLYPDDKSSISLVGYFGPEQADNNQNDRYGINAVLFRKLGSNLSAWAQGDYGQEQKADPADPTKDAKWWALGGWLAYDLTPKVGLAVRGDYMDDKQGARTGGAFGLAPGTRQKLGSGTVTLNVRAWPNALVRPEIRYDRSNLTPFDGKKDQVTFALSAAYIY